MRLATIRTAAGNRAVRVDLSGEAGGGTAVETGDADLRALLERPDWAERAAAAAGPTHDVAGLDYAPLVPSPEKIICVGLNYRDHVLEMGHDLPEYPTLFAKYAPALVGAYDDIVLPSVSDKVDYEAELVVVIGSSVRHATPEQATAAIAGYSVLNDVSVRDYQNRTSQFLQGKTFEASTPLGPWLVTPDELPEGGWAISTTLDGETMQDSSTAELVFGPVDLIVYLSAIITLNPGDVIATGTPGGVGHARKPPRYLTDGATVVTTVAGVGELRNAARSEKR
ncbi:fumarylacetoacetate hydrolase family protein [Pseudonocardia sp. GCM10023141]|uniref:fumarylacetoacetate hydrolase family protein n=1 Tax=Pseudonocardia sp. GCM10023141 TaxID=3252653 RepID=UPI00360653D6